jgi:hypothetical protein
MHNAIFCSADQCHHFAAFAATAATQESHKTGAKVSVVLRGLVETILLILYILTM